MASRSATILAAAPAIRSRHGLNDKSQRKAFGEAVRSRREEMGIERKAFAAELEVSYSTVAHIESGWNWPLLPIYRRICEVLKVGKPPLMG